jgi:two-component system cell cycle response regulator CtrA
MTDAACACPTCGTALPSTIFAIDREAGIVVSNGRFAHLAPQEFQIFLTLYDAKGKLRSKEQLLRAVAPMVDREPEIKIVDVYVCKIRRKLAGTPIEIQTVWGDGYRLVSTARMESAGE